jgi:hypothetical protein
LAVDLTLYIFVKHLKKHKMKKLIVSVLVALSLFSCKTVQVTSVNSSNDSYTYVQKDTSERIIKVFTDTSYVEEPVLTTYKELIFSQGDSTVVYENDYIIVGGKGYISPETSTWYNCKSVIVYR